jgi:RES domain-containing protein
VLTSISGKFVRLSFPDQADIALNHPAPERPAARFNRLGQSALYLSPDELSARVAIGEYVKENDPPRVLVTYEVAPCTVIDLHHPEAADLYSRARQPWQSALSQGEDPSSWAAADTIRSMPEAVGLIDPSRRRPGLWHITLFRWNERYAPALRLIDIGAPLTLPVGFR